MYAAILRDRVADPSRQAEVAARLNAGLTPLFRYSPGCIVCYVLTADDGEVTSIGIFADRAAAEAAARSATEWIGAQVAELIDGAPQVSIGVVSVH